MARYTREQIITVLQNLSKQVDTPRLSTKQVATVLAISTVKRHFGSLGDALEAAGLERTDSSEHFRGRGLSLSDNQLFENLYDIEKEVGREPTFNECSAHGKFSIKPYKKRFGQWGDVLAHYRKWKSENGIDPGNYSNQSEQLVIKNQVSSDLSTNETSVTVSVRKRPVQLYGEPIDFRGLRHAPINEQGVVFLFGMVSRELGFNIEAIQQGFPDCEGKYLHDKKRNLWAKARIEFEYRSSSFVEHGHSQEHCDFIVCWIHDWSDCPLDVIELSKEILKLPST